MTFSPRGEADLKATMSLYKRVSSSEVSGISPSKNDPRRAGIGKRLRGTPATILAWLRNSLVVDIFEVWVAAGFENFLLLAMGLIASGSFCWSDRSYPQGLQRGFFQERCNKFVTQWQFVTGFGFRYTEEPNRRGKNMRFTGLLQIISTPLYTRKIATK